jgi:hypothetical protein
MTLGLTSTGEVKIKTDDGGLRAVNCACCVTPPLGCGFVKITDSALIALLNSATSGSFNYSHGTDSAPLWTPTGANTFIAEWNCCFNNPDGCDNCFFVWEYLCALSWDGSILGLYAFDFPWGYYATPAGGECSDCVPPVELQISINGFQILMGMNFGCDTGFPIYPVSINLT